MQNALHTSQTSIGGFGQTALIEGLRDASDPGMWNQLVARYRPRLVRMAMKMGLRSADAEDAAQVVLMEFAGSLGTYDRSKGTLRQWLFGIARRQVLNARRRSPREHAPGRDTRTTGYFDRIPEGAPSEWRGEHEAELMRRCLDRVEAEVSEQTMEAFRLFALQGLPAAVVAQQLGISENAVFGAKRRVLERVREAIGALEHGGC